MFNAPEAATCTFEPKIAEFLMSDVMANLSDQVTTTAGNVGGYAAGAAASGVALYSILWVVAFVSGSQNGDVISFIKWLARAMVLIALAGTASIYQEYVIDTFWDTPSEVAQFVATSGMTNDSVQYDVAGKLNMGTALDAAATQGTCAGINIWKASSGIDVGKTVGLFLAGLIVILGVVIFVAAAAGLAFVGYASLSIVLALGPIFIIFGIWETTKPMMESWLRTAINYALYGVVLMVIVGLGIGLVSKFGASTLGSIKDGGDLFEALSLAVRSLFVFAIATALLLKADDISASLVGGISLGAAGTLGKAAGGLGSLAKGARAAKNAAANPSKTWGEAKGGSFHRNARGQMIYKSKADERADHKEALRNARNKNSNGVKPD